MMYEELVKRLRETSIDFGELDHISVMLLEAADAIEKSDVFNLIWQEAAKIAHEAEPKWIPVTERLPEIGQFVLVFIDGNVEEACRSDRFKGSPFVQFGNWGIYKNKVTHWMPLPGPPLEVDG